MAKETEVSAEMSSMAKEGVERAREGMKDYFDFLRQIISVYPSGGTEFGEKLKRNAEQNVAALQEYVTKLSQATTVQDAVRVQTEFVQTQFNAFSEQAKELMETYTKAAESTIKAART